MVALLPKDIQRSSTATTTVADSAGMLIVFIALLTLLPSPLVFVGIAVTPAVIVGWGLALAWAAAHLAADVGMWKGATPTRTAVLVLAGTLLLTYAYTTYGYLLPGDLKNSDRNMLLWVAALGGALVAADGLRTMEAVRRVVRSITALCAVVAVIGIVQTLTGTNIADKITLPGLRQNGLAALGQAARDGLARAQATTGHPIEFGVLCAIALPLAVHLALTESRSRDRSLYGICAAALVAGAVFSVSRSAIIGLAAAGVVVFLGASTTVRVRGLGLIVVFGLVLWQAAPQVLNTLYKFFASVGSDPSVSARTGGYPVAFAEFARHPLLGRGVGTWYGPVHQIFDNQYLLSLVETGVVGVAALLGLFLTTFATALRVRTWARESEARDLALALAAAAAVPTLTAATFDLLSYPTVTSIYFVLVGVVAALTRIIGPSAPAESEMGAVTSRIRRSVTVS